MNNQVRREQMQSMGSTYIEAGNFLGKKLINKTLNSLFKLFPKNTNEQNERSCPIFQICSCQEFRSNRWTEEGRQKCLNLLVDNGVIHIDENKSARPRRILFQAIPSSFSRKPSLIIPKLS